MTLGLSFTNNIQLCQGSQVPRHHCLREAMCVCYRHKNYEKRKCFISQLHHRCVEEN